MGIGDKSNEELEKLFVDVPPAHKFWLHKGGSLSNLEELYEELREISEEIFEHHVNRYRNDFAAWVKDVIKDEELAKELGKAITKDDAIDAIEERIRKAKNIKSPLPHSQTLDLTGTEISENALSKIKSLVFLAKTFIDEGEVENIKKVFDDIKENYGQIDSFLKRRKAKKMIKELKKYLKKVK